MKRVRFLIVTHLLNNEAARSLLAPVYRGCAFFVIKLLEWRFPSLKVWTRNSIVSNDIVPGISDIDLTLYSLTVLDRGSEIFIRELHSHLKKIIPILGEWNFYYSDDVSILKHYFNPIELSRDPKLAAIVQQRREAEQIEKGVYLLRQWKSDQHYLNIIPNLRTKKWKRIAQRVGIRIENVNFDYIKTQINEFVTPNFDSTEKKICFYPHEWLGENWRESDLDESKKILSEFTASEQQYCLKQIYWEVCGILCQLPFLENPIDMNSHLYNLSQLIAPYVEYKEIDELGKVAYRIRERYALA